MHTLLLLLFSLTFTSPAPVGSGIDPDGLRIVADSGCSIDPSGSCRVTALAGSSMDPNGRGDAGARIDDNG